MMNEDPYQRLAEMEARQVQRLGVHAVVARVDAAERYNEVRERLAPRDPIIIRVMNTKTGDTLLRHLLGRLLNDLTSRLPQPEHVSEPIGDWGDEWSQEMNENPE